MAHHDFLTALFKLLLPPHVNPAEYLADLRALQTSINELIHPGDEVTLLSLIETFVSRFRESSTLLTCLFEVISDGVLYAIYNLSVSHPQETIEFLLGEFAKDLGYREDPDLVSDTKLIIGIIVDTLFAEQPGERYLPIGAFQGAVGFTFQNGLPFNHADDSRNFLWMVCDAVANPDPGRKLSRFDFVRVMKALMASPGETYSPNMIETAITCIVDILIDDIENGPNDLTVEIMVALMELFSQRTSYIKTLIDYVVDTPMVVRTRVGLNEVRVTRQFLSRLMLEARRVESNAIRWSDAPSADPIVSGSLASQDNDDVASPDAVPECHCTKSAIQCDLLDPNSYCRMGETYRSIPNIELFSKVVLEWGDVSDESLLFLLTEMSDPISKTLLQIELLTTLFQQSQADGLPSSKAVIGYLFIHRMWIPCTANHSLGQHNCLMKLTEFYEKMIEIEDRFPNGALRALLDGWISRCRLRPVGNMAPPLPTRLTL